MERLTKHSKQTSHENGICCTHFRGPECLEVGGNCAMNCKWEEAAWSRLAAYEDTGLTSQEVISMHGEWRAMMSVLNSIGGGYTRLRELAEADRAGRLVVLPVKPVLTPTISSMLYIIEDGEIYEDSLYEGIVGMSERGEMNVIYGTIDALSFEQNDIGKTVFLTREEAERALEAMKDV